MNLPFQVGSEIWPGLAKLVEEAGEVLQVTGKLGATGGADQHWDGSDLRTRIQEELGDLIAAAYFVIHHNQLDENFIRERAKTKRDLYETWRAGEG
jgi:NTP pyrophosphatase (non-canonical NTP hydrolase)